MKTPKYVIAPEGCKKWLTPRKSYRVMDFNGIGFDVVADDGTKIHTILEGSRHLNGGDWIIPDDEAEAPAGDEPVPVYDGGPAFAGGDPVHGGHPGMSLRAYAAVAAMQGMGTWMPDYTMRPALSSDEALVARAEWAVRQADALLAALTGKTNA